MLQGSEREGGGGSLIVACEGRGGLECSVRVQKMCGLSSAFVAVFFSFLVLLRFFEKWKFIEK